MYNHNNYNRTDLDKLDDCKIIKNLIDVRIRRQQDLLDKIASGSWKTTSLNDDKLYKIAKWELKYLEDIKTSNDVEIENMTNMTSTANVRPTLETTQIPASTTEPITSSLNSANSEYKHENLHNESFGSDSHLLKSGTESFLPESPISGIPGLDDILSTNTLTSTKTDENTGSTSNDVSKRLFPESGTSLHARRDSSEDYKHRDATSISPTMINGLNCDSNEISDEIPGQIGSF